MQLYYPPQSHYSYAPAYAEPAYEPAGPYGHPAPYAAEEPPYDAGVYRATNAPDAVPPAKRTWKDRLFKKREKPATIRDLQAVERGELTNRPPADSYYDPAPASYHSAAPGLPAPRGSRANYEDPYAAHGYDDYQRAYPPAAPYLYPGIEPDPLGRPPAPSRRPPSPAKAPKREKTRRGSTTAPLRLQDVQDQDRQSYFADPFAPPAAAPPPTRRAYGNQQRPELPPAPSRAQTGALELYSSPYDGRHPYDDDYFERGYGQSYPQGYGYPRHGYGYSHAPAAPYRYPAAYSHHDLGNPYVTPMYGAAPPVFGAPAPYGASHYPGLASPWW